MADLYRPPPWDEDDTLCPHGFYAEACGDCTHPEERPRPDIAQMATAFSQYLNASYPPEVVACDELVGWRRVTKVCEEAGEVDTAWRAFVGENPRKPRGPIEDVIKELADCVGAALGAIEHLTGHQGRSLDIATERVRSVCDRVGVLTENAPAD